MRGSAYFLYDIPCVTPNEGANSPIVHRARLPVVATRFGGREQKVEQMPDRNFASICRLEESSPEALEVLPHEQ